VGAPVILTLSCKPSASAPLQTQPRSALRAARSGRGDRLEGFDSRHSIPFLGKGEVCSEGGLTGCGRAGRCLTRLDRPIVCKSRLWIAVCLGSRNGAREILDDPP
jgi:hypothetical protein